MPSYNQRLNKVFTEFKNYAYKNRGWGSVVLQPSCFNNVGRYFGGDLNWEERNDVINLMQKRMNGVQCVEHGPCNSIVVWF